MLFSSFKVFKYCSQFWTGILPSSWHSSLTRNVNRTLLTLLSVNQIIQMYSLCNCYLLDPGAIECRRWTASNFHGVEVIDWLVTLTTKLLLCRRHHILSPDAITDNIGLFKLCLNTTCRSVSRWKLLEQKYENFTIRGRFPTNAKLSQNF